MFGDWLSFLKLRTPVVMLSLEGREKSILISWLGGLEIYLLEGISSLNVCKGPLVVGKTAERVSISDLKPCELARLLVDRSAEASFEIRSKLILLESLDSTRFKYAS